MTENLAGVIPVLPTPFLPGGDIDRQSFARVIDHLISRGVRGVMFPGFASEFYKLDEAEKATLTADLIRQTADTGTLAVLAVQSHATRQAVTEARRLVDAGAGALNLLPPHYMSPSSEAILSHCAAVLDAVPETPVILQYAPTGTTPIPPAAIRKLAAEHSNLAAVKVESRPPYSFIAALAEEPCAVPSFAGSGGLYMLDSLRLGAIGVQPGSGFVELYQQIYSSWQSGETSRSEEVFLRLLRYLVGWANEQERMVAMEKLIMHRRGMIDNADCRTPHRSLSFVETESVDRFMTEFAEYFEEEN